MSKKKKYTLEFSSQFLCCLCCLFVVGYLLSKLDHDNVANFTYGLLLENLGLVYEVATQSIVSTGLHDPRATPVKHHYT